MKRFGTFKGVYVPSNNAILGTVLFLLLPALTADVGLIAMAGVILLAHSVTFTTAFSLADCATNLNEIGGGGMYALSKRSLGRSLGGAIGIQLYFAQAASIGFYCIGFAEPLQSIVAPYLQFLPWFQNASPGGILLQKQIIASTVFMLFFITAMVGADFTLKIQTLILVILTLSILTIFISPFRGIEFNGESLFKGSLARINLSGNRGLTLGIFFATFTQFFPAVTGIDAGVGMSGDLKEPRKSLVRGTFIAILVTLAVYLVSTVIFSLIRKDYLIIGYKGSSPVGGLLTEILGLALTFPGNIFGVVILMGILFATSSSALSCFMTAPRTAQSLAQDDVLPGFLGFLKNDFFQSGTEPRFATLVTLFVAISVIWIGNINLAAMIVGICFLAVYGWVNGSAFLERISGNPSFRPTSKGHWLISLYGFVSCVATILLFNVIIGVAVIITQYVIFQLILRYKSESRLEGVWWGVLFSFISSGIKSLKKIAQGSKNWRPLLTAISFAGRNNYPRNIAELAAIIASYKGLVHLNVMRSIKDPEVLDDTSAYPVSTNVIEVTSHTEAVLAVIQMNHYGDLKQNTVLMEYSSGVDTVSILNRILSLDCNVLLLKNSDRFRWSRRIDIWWRGERNGNLMVLLAYIMKTSSEGNHSDMEIRIIRKLDADQKPEPSYREMEDLLKLSRLTGEIYIIPYSDEPFNETVRNTSGKADLIMMGLPGNYLDKKENSRKGIFNLDEYFFNKEITRYDDLPPILFVRSVSKIRLIED